jgi:hypothetical protein
MMNDWEWWRGGGHSVGGGGHGDAHGGGGVHGFKFSRCN